MQVGYLKNVFVQDKGLKGEYPDYKIHEYDILRESLQHKVRRILAECVFRLVI